MANGITTNLVIRFQSAAAAAAANAHLSAEVDARADGLNAGKTTFIFGDSPAYLIFRTSNVSYTQDTTSGSVTAEGTGTISVDETITFAGETEASLSKPPSGAVTFTLVTGKNIDVSKLVVTGMKVSYPLPAGETALPLAVVRATYLSGYEAFRLTGVVDPAIPGLDEVEVIVYILGTVT